MPVFYDRGMTTPMSASLDLAARITGMIEAGELPPGTQLSEVALAEELGVSRNTLREAFRLLSHERLLEHVFNRGVFVRSPTPEDLHELYRFRRVLECAAVRHASAASVDLSGMRAAVDEGLRASRVSDWSGVGTANIHFHQALGALTRSARMDETMSHLLAELRLVFHTMADTHAFHQPYLPKNQHLLGLLEEGSFAEAEAYLMDYLDIAERQLLEAMGE